MWLTGIFALVACAVFAFAIIRHKSVPEGVPISETTPARGSQATAIDGFTVVRIADGDSLTLVGTDKLEISIRLRGIDAPELGQPYGFEAKQTLQAMLESGKVMIRDTKKGKYGRYIANVYIGDAFINQAMVENGHAWCDQVNSYSRIFCTAQQKAKDQGLGLWASPTPVSPWVWRAERK